MENFLAEIRTFPYDAVPGGWARCDGQVLLIAQNMNLYSLLGAIYGGDGVTTFCLPDLRGRAAMQPGTGQGLTPRALGENGGQETVTLFDPQMPRHSHSFSTSVRLSDSLGPDALAAGIGNTMFSPAEGASLAPASPNAITPTGGSEPHNNMQPFLAVNFCIALQGIYPSKA